MKLWRTLLGNLSAGPATRPFPRVPLAPAPGARGNLRLILEKCTFCRACEVRCPAHALEVDKKGRTWVFDPFRCIYCHYCVEICPFHALAMDPLPPEPAAVKTTVREVGSPSGAA